MRIDLTDKVVRTVQPEDGKAELLCWDQGQDGLYLRVRANGKRNYFVSYVIAGRERRLAIGSTSERTLADARHRAYEIRSMAKDGVDPCTKFRPQATLTVSKAVEQYLAYLESAKKSNSTCRQAKLYLTGPYFAPLHGLDIGNVTKKTVGERLTVIAQTHSRITAGAARSNLSALYVWLNKTHFDTVEYNPVKGTEEYRNDNARDRVLSDTELAAIWKACGDDRYGRIVRLLILTGCRRQEVGGLCKAEVDLSNRTWTIPKTRYKTKIDHTVHLAPAAVDLVTAMGDVGNFDNWSHFKAQLDARLGDTVAPWTHHDLRRTMRTGLADLEVPEHVAEMAIGHVQAKIVRTYNKNKYAGPLREAFEKWAARVARLTGDNVVEFHVSRDAA